VKGRKNAYSGPAANGGEPGRISQPGIDDDGEEKEEEKEEEEEEEEEEEKEEGRRKKEKEENESWRPSTFDQNGLYATTGVLYVSLATRRPGHGVFFQYNVFLFFFTALPLEQLLLPCPAVH
jgi:hypothetical protein